MVIETRLDNIVMKPSDFKVCKKCGRLNWYESGCCFDCGNEKFNNSKKAVLSWAVNEYEYWQEIEDYTEQEADAILIEV